MAFSAPDKHKAKFASQLALYIYELSTIQFSQIGRILHSDEPESLQLVLFSFRGSLIGPLSTSLEYFHRFRRAQTKAILQEHRGEQEWEAAAWFLEKAVTSMVTDEHIYGPFPLCHIDLHFNNILVDGDYNITGIIDWSHAQTVPIERFALIPEFIPPPAASATFKQAIIEFRDMFVGALKKVEWRRTGHCQNRRHRCTVVSHRPFRRLSVDAPTAIRGEPFLMPDLFFLFCMGKALNGMTFRSSTVSVLHETYQLPM